MVVIGNFNINIRSMYDLILVLDGGVIPASTVVGILLNVIGMFFLCVGSRKFKVFSLLLITLLAFDTIFLISGLMRKFEHYILPVSKKYLAIYHVSIHSVIRCSAISSIFMVMVMSHARLWAIRKPFFHNSNILSWQERNLKYIFLFLKKFKRFEKFHPMMALL